jgi:hypothetical protein
MSEPIEKDVEAYKKLLPTLVADEGKFALIGNGELAGVYGTYEDALSIGYQKFGINPFLVKKISAVEQVHYFSRDILTKCLT